MEGTRAKRTAEQIRSAEEGWTEIGATLAATVVEGGKTRSWVWDLIKPLSLYRRWMIGYWVEKYERQHAERLANLERNKKSRKKVLELVPVLDEAPD